MGNKFRDFAFWGMTGAAIAGVAGVIVIGGRSEMLERQRDELREQRDKLGGSFMVEKDAVIECREALKRCHLDRDNLANELADSRADCLRTSEELGKAMEREDKLKERVEQLAFVNASLTADLDCCRQELKKAESCVKCHRRHK